MLDLEHSKQDLDKGVAFGSDWEADEKVEKACSERGLHNSVLEGLVPGQRDSSTL